MRGPEALMIAGWLESGGSGTPSLHALRGARELRRLHAESATLADSCAAKADRVDRLGETVQRLTAERDELRDKLEDAEENVELLGLVAQGHIDLLQEREADRAAMREALEALTQTTAMCAEGTSTRKDVGAAIQKLKARLG